MDRHHTPLEFTNAVKELCLKGKLVAFHKDKHYCLLDFSDISRGTLILNPEAADLKVKLHAVSSLPSF